MAIACLVGACVGARGPIRPAPSPVVAAQHDAPAPAPVVGQPRSDLIPRALLFGNPERTAPQLSPDGAWMSWLAPVDGVLNVWVAPASDAARAKPLTAASRPILESEWSFDGKHLLYWQDGGGDEHEHVFRVAVATGEVVDLTPLPGASARGLWLSPRKPDQLLVELNDRDPSSFDVHAIDLSTGRRRLVARNDGQFSAWIVDRDLAVRFGQRVAEDGTRVWMVKRGKRWRRYDGIPPEDVLATAFLGFAANAREFYTLDSRGRDTAALFVVDAATKARRLLHADPHVDLGGWHQAWIGPSTLVHPTEANVQAILVDDGRPRWVAIDPRVAKDLDALAELDPGMPRVTSRTLDDATWIVAFESDVRSRRFYRWDRRTQRGELLFAERPEFDAHALVPMRPVTIEARDGLSLPSYLLLPRHADADADGQPERAVPMVLSVHGGPWYRDRWGFNPVFQLLADRGYAVLSVNFRGSTGFGKAFTNAGDGQWGKAMQDDLLDAVDWAVGHGVARKDAICITGYSYGGYATLVGLTKTPDVFACGVDIVGPSNLVTTFEGIPPAWREDARLFQRRVGDWHTDAGRQALLDLSPLTHVDRITKPLLVAHGANDTRAQRRESDQIVAAMQAKGIPVGYLVFPDEGHFFVRPENNRAFFAVAEAFLSLHIGGDHQPIDDAELRASSMVVEAGARWLPGLGPPSSVSPPR